MGIVGTLAVQAIFTSAKRATGCDAGAEQSIPQNLLQSGFVQSSERGHETDSCFCVQDPATMRLSGIFSARSVVCTSFTIPGGPQTK